MRAPSVIATQSRGADKSQNEPFPRQPEILAETALIQWFARRAEKTPNAVAYRYKDYGIWHEVRWKEYREIVEKVALALHDLGVGKGDRVAMMGEATPEWLALDFAAQSVGAIFFGIYVTMKPEDLRYVLTDGSPKLFMAEDQEYVDKLLQSEELAQKKLVGTIVVADTRGMFQYADERIVSFEQLAERGSRNQSSMAGHWERWVAEQTPDNTSRIAYTSGTTGRPKGAMLSSRNQVWGASSLYWSVNNEPGPADRTISYMPPASPAEVAFSVVLPCLFGTIPHIPEDAEGRNDAFVEVCPTLLLGFPRLFETQAARAQVDIETGRRTKRIAYKLAMRLAEPYHHAVAVGQTPGMLDQIKKALATQLLFRHLLDKFGLRKGRFVITGGAPVSPDIMRLWNTWGVAVQEIYGMTEVGGLATVQMEDRPMPGIAGRALHGMEIRVEEDGELLLRSPGVFQGYWQKPDATADVLDSDGWLHTGDIGQILPDGNLKIVDRRSDLIETNDGRVVAASEIEHLVKRSPYVREAMLAGQGREYLSVLIEIDPAAVSEWARANKVLYTSFSSLIESPLVIRLFADAVRSVNKELVEMDKPLLHDFRIMPKELDPEDGDEVTSTNKVRRRQLGEKFSELLEEMYSGGRSLLTQADKEPLVGDIGREPLG